MPEPLPRDHSLSQVAAVRGGDREAFAALFHEHYDGLCRFAEGYVRSPEAAQEIVQQIFLRLWEHRARWVVRDTVRTYLYGAVRNRALDWLKHQRVEDRWRERIAWADTDRIPGMGQPTPPADLRAEAGDFAAALDRAIQDLPERYRAVVELRARQGMTIAEIARILDIPFKTAEARAARALRSLRAALAPFRR
jgi:RNA polymerase sigma-70 factor (ECF subfamily)